MSGGISVNHRLASKVSPIYRSECSLKKIDLTIDLHEALAVELYVMLSRLLALVDALNMDLLACHWRSS
jgi:hypothetical protein